MTRTFLLLAGALLALGAVQAQTVQIGPNGVSVNVTGAGVGGTVYAVTGSGKTLTYTCHNSSVAVSGSANQLTLKGSCRSLSVSGSSNSVSVAAVGRVAVSGSANRVTWHSGLNGGRPLIGVTGVGNTVAHR